MKKYNTLWLLLIALFSIVAGCKKDTASTATQLDILPPATQIGTNTFVCLVNGKVWIPKGYDGTGGSNPHVIFSTGLNGQPYLSIDTYQYIDNQSQGNIFVAFGNLNHSGYYPYQNDLDFLVGWSKVLGNCTTVAYDTTIKKWGGGQITKLDITNHIISGTFNFKFKTLQCDTVFITDGRFDIKF